MYTAGTAALATDADDQEDLMTLLTCPKGHTSTEPDYCSECGALISNSAATAKPANGATCPDCGTPREHEDIVFCEICGYNFATRARGELPVEPPATGAAQPDGWTLEVSVDPILREPGSPEPPPGVGPFPFTLEPGSSLIGRRSETRAIFPEIPLSYDDAVSHRHALLQWDGQGTLQLRDIGSANGTRLNGNELPAMVDHPLHDGDEITLGHWSRIRVRATH
jgi:hypothetical protein